MKMHKANGVLDAGEHGYKRILTGTLANTDTVLKSEG